MGSRQVLPLPGTPGPDDGPGLTLIGPPQRLASPLRRPVRFAGPCMCVHAAHPREVGCEGLRTTVLTVADPHVGDAAVVMCPPCAGWWCGHRPDAVLAAGAIGDPDRTPPVYAVLRLADQALGGALAAPDVPKMLVWEGRWVLLASAATTRLWLAHPDRAATMLPARRTGRFEVSDDGSPGRVFRVDPDGARPVPDEEPW